MREIIDEERFAVCSKAAVILGVPYSALKAMRYKGELPGFYSGNRFYVNLLQARKKFGIDVEPNIQETEWRSR